MTPVWLPVVSYIVKRHRFRKIITPIPLGDNLKLNYKNSVAHLSLCSWILSRWTQTRKADSQEGFTGLVPLPLTAERKGKVVPPFSQEGWVWKQSLHGPWSRYSLPHTAAVHPQKSIRLPCGRAGKAKLKKQPPANAISIWVELIYQGAMGNWLGSN